MKSEIGDTSIVKYGSTRSCSGGRVRLRPGEMYGNSARRDPGVPTSSLNGLLREETRDGVVENGELLADPNMVAISSMPGDGGSPGAAAANLRDLRATRVYDATIGAERCSTLVLDSLHFLQQVWLELRIHLTFLTRHEWQACPAGSMLPLRFCEDWEGVATPTALCLVPTAGEEGEAARMRV